LTKRGYKAVIVNNLPNDASVHMTFMTSLTQPTVPFVFDLLNGSNTGRDFADFVHFLLNQHYLVPGDFLIIDNATVHITAEHGPVLIAALDAANVCLRQVQSLIRLGASLVHAELLTGTQPMRVVLC
jgi:hypothetical protein